MACLTDSSVWWPCISHLAPTTVVWNSRNISRVVVKSEKKKKKTVDCGNVRLDPEDDYPVYAQLVAEQVVMDEDARYQSFGSELALWSLPTKFPARAVQMRWISLTCTTRASSRWFEYLAPPAILFHLPEQQVQIFWIYPVWDSGATRATCSAKNCPNRNKV